MNTKARTVQYKGYTIVKAILEGFTGDVVNGWDVTRNGIYYTAAHTLREAKIAVDMLVEDSR